MVLLVTVGPIVPVFAHHTSAEVGRAHGQSVKHLQADLSNAREIIDGQVSASASEGDLTAEGEV